VFYIQPQEIGSRAGGSSADVMRRNMEMQLKQTASYSATQALHLAAKIEDKRLEAGF